MNSLALELESPVREGVLDAILDRVAGVYWLVLTLKSTVFYTLPSFQGMYAPFYPLLALAAIRGLTGPRRPISIFLASSYYAFLLLTLMALLFAEVAITTDTARRLFFYGFAGVAFLACLRESCVRFLIVMQVVTSIVISTWVIYTAWHTGLAYRGGIQINWNYVSMILGAGALVLAHYAFNRLGRIWHPRVWLTLGAFAATLYSLFLLASRGTIVALICALPFVTVGTANKRVPRMVIGIALILIAAYGILQLPGGQTILDRALTDRVESLNFRLPIWEAILNEYSSGSLGEILVGRGIDAGEYLVGSTVVGLGTLHNGFLQVLFEEGLLGLASFLAIHAWCFLKLTVGTHPYRQYALVILVYCAVANLSGSYEHLAEYWLMLAATAAVALCSNRPPRNDWPSRAA